MCSLANVPIHPHKSLHWHLSKRILKIRGIYQLLLFLSVVVFIGLTPTQTHAQQDTTTVAQDTVKNVPYKPSRRPTFKLRDRYGDPFSTPVTKSPLFLKDPTKLTFEVNYDSGVNYTVYEKIGELNFRPVTQMTFEEFKAFQERQLLTGYWKGKSRGMDGESAVTSRGLIPKIFISPVLDKLFGGSYVELIPRGFVTLDFGGSFQRISNPAIPIRQQRNGGFEFDQQINMSVTGKVGEKLTVNANFDNNNSFDFQNNMKVEYTGFKEEILKKIEIGNVSLPLNNTLIQGSQNLFGIKTQMQFGKLFVTSIASTQRGKVESITIPTGSGGQGRPLELIASLYDESRHFFLGHFFRDNYEAWTRNTPQIISGVNITRVEVYIINRSVETQTLRTVVGLADLGEPRVIYNSNPLLVSPTGFTTANDNRANTLFSNIVGLGVRANDDIINALQGAQYENGTDFERINGARRLAPTEFTFHKQLGYLTLSRKLQSDEALAVAYEYTYNGRTFKVGELSEDYANLGTSEVVFLKLLRSRNYFPTNSQGRTLPMWDLMMKNIYSLNVNQFTREGFELRIIYRDDKTGIDNPQLQDGTVARNRQLIEILGLDRLNPVNDPPGDGNFDFIEGLTVNTQSGLIIFPYLEPFNTPLREAFINEPNRDFMIKKYVFDTLYRIPKAQAERFTTKNKFYLVGKYSAAGSSNEIMIPGFGVSPGSVRLYAGGTPLIEQQDFVVDYTFGRITILNESILNSGKVITVDYEQSDPFAFQTRSLLGSRFDYKLSDDVNFGSTILYYNERPLISRNLIGTEPARNVQYGFDFNIRKDSRLLTKWIDALPGIQTKETSTININAEFAQLIPGTSNIVDGTGTAYIDDFENTATPYSLMSPIAWKLASVPKTDNPTQYDPTGGASRDIRAGDKRAKLAWYQVDNQFYREGGQFKPGNITNADLQNHYMRAVDPQEIFPKRNRTQGNFFEQILDVAYYPRERGPYNYNTNLILNTDTESVEFNPNAVDIKKNWAGITTAIRTEVDFNKANIEYIEFWLLDPFIEGPNGRVVVNKNQAANNTTGGKLIFHLGNVSEDVLRDSRHAFENGLPPDGNPASASESPWGIVTNQSYLTNAFDNSPASRANQDVGLDGISDTKEEEKFRDVFLNAIGDPQVQGIVRTDPSADNFTYFLGRDLDNANAKILERYRNFNGQEGNTPITGNDVIARSGSPYPDNEDLNADNTISELEEYYEYSIDLNSSNLSVGKEYIVDKITVSPTGNPDQVTWYLFRIPIQQFKNKFGNISGFTSIRYARMILTDFQDPVVLRFANFRMVGSRWLKYDRSLKDGGLVDDPEPGADNFTLSVVNIEENSQGDIANGKSPYVVPPGFIRDRDNTSSVARQLNEQSVQMCVDGLEDGDARAIYKLVGMDFFNYGRVKMFVHANSNDADDDALSVFMRLGTDYDENYYEVEIPLKITPAANTSDRAIWPEENEFDFSLNDLYALKVFRDRNNISLDEVYTKETPVGRHTIRIIGRPDLTQVKMLMIGVRNPRTADKRSYSVCVWANELRLTDFDRTAGWAVNTSISSKLADFATVTGSLRYTTFGFGGVSSKISERTRDETTSYDITANINVDKFFLSNTGIKIPLLLSYENTTINPQFDPANPDLRIDAALKSFNTDQEREAYKKLIQDRRQVRSLNFTNVRKVKLNPQAKVNLWDVENLSFNYSYSEATQRSFTIDESIRRLYRGGAAYNFSPKATGIEPFKSAKGLKSPYLKLIKDFNFSLLPNNILVRGDLERSFVKNVYRNSLSSSAPQYQKYFVFNRQYNVRWNLTKSLSLDYSARANAIIDEPDGEGKEVNDALRKGVRNFGRMKNYDQNITFNYVLPLDKIPFTDWLNVDYRHQLNYNWRSGPLNFKDTDPKRPITDLPDSLDFKHTIQNSRDRTVSGRIDMTKLYNKFKFLKEINTPPKPIVPGRQPVTKQPDTVKVTPPLVKTFFRTLMSLRSINGSYTVTEGTTLPGFDPTPTLFGMNDFGAPGWKFILGSQNPNIRYKAAENGWLVQGSSLTTPFSQSKTRSIAGRANIEPSSDFKIQLDVKKDVSDSYQEIFRYDPDNNLYQSLNPSRVGNYKISILAINTSFDPTNQKINSKVFNQFERNLDVITERFNTITPGAEYDTTGQDVTIAAFIAAYTGKSASTVNLSPFPKTPLPNWRIDYTGLTKIPAFKNVFQAITISHAYSASYSVLNYSNSLQYADPGKVGIGVPIERYNNGVFGQVIDGRVVPIYVISQVLISEQFAPLIGVNVRTKNRLTVRADYKTKRDLALNVSNAQVTEAISKDVSFELGYTKNNMRLPIKSQGRTLVLKNDVTFRMNLTVSDSKTIQRKIDELNAVTAGNINFQLRPNISYIVNQKLSIQMYFERTVNDPAISSSFRRATTRFGGQIRFSLAQ
jgi:cell surface protein SprA